MQIDTLIHRRGCGLKMAACLALLLAAGIGCRSQEIAARQEARREYIRRTFADLRAIDKERPAWIRKVFSESQELQRERNLRLENPPIFIELITMGAGKAPVEK